MVHNDRPVVSTWCGAKTMSGSVGEDPTTKDATRGGRHGTTFNVALPETSIVKYLTIGESGRYVLTSSADTYPATSLVAQSLVPLFDLTGQGTSGTTCVDYVINVPVGAEGGIVLDAVNTTTQLHRAVDAYLLVALPAAVYPALSGNVGTKEDQVRCKMTIQNNSRHAVYFVASKPDEKESINYVARSVAARPNETVTVIYDLVSRQWLVQ